VLRKDHAGKSNSSQGQEKKKANSGPIKRLQSSYAIYMKHSSSKHIMKKMAQKANTSPEWLLSTSIIGFSVASV